MTLTARRFYRYGVFLRNYFAFRRLTRKGSSRPLPRWHDRYPCLDDNTRSTEFDRHYIYHPAWAARIIAAHRPPEHIDISSTLHFSSMISAFVPVQFFDYRPADVRLSNLRAGQADLLALPFATHSIASLSCMHVVEHIGLGRYGDPLDPDGDRKAIRELCRVLAPGGSLLFVVPVGTPRIEFNAHRVYGPDEILHLFGELQLREFTLIPEKAEDGGPVTNPPRALVERQQYGCGCFWFTRG